MQAKRNKKVIEKSLLTLIESFIDNDPTGKLPKIYDRRKPKVKKTRIGNDEIDA